MSARITEYEKYTLLDLYQVLNSIREDLVPHVYEALLKEIRSREPGSVMEFKTAISRWTRRRTPSLLKSCASK